MLVYIHKYIYIYISIKSNLNCIFTFISDTEILIKF